MIRQARGLALVFVFTLFGCQVAPPTKVAETRQRPFAQVTEKAQRPLEINDLTVVLDTRASFDFGLNHVINSYNFPWAGLAEKEATGELLRDPRQAALRLSLLGINPQTPVVIVGPGPRAGKGEEGRLAWNLLYLGVQDVQVSAIEPLRKSMTQQSSPPAQNTPLWKANPREELQIGKAEFINWATKPKERMEKRVHIIDVRSDKEYLNKPDALAGKAPLPDLTAINIEWSQFYTPQGRPDIRFKDKLLALGIRPEDRIILISNRGVRSAAAAYALLALGYERVQNFTGGWNSLRP